MIISPPWGVLYLAQGSYKVEGGADVVLYAQFQRCGTLVQRGRIVHPCHSGTVLVHAGSKESAPHPYKPGVAEDSGH